MPSRLSKPTAADWADYLDSLVHWEKFALYLNIEQHEVDIIKRNNGQVADQKGALWTRWTKIYPNGTWSDVIAALKRMQENWLAAEIERKLQEGVIRGGTEETDHPGGRRKREREKEREREREVLRKVESAQLPRLKDPPPVSEEDCPQIMCIETTFVPFTDDLVKGVKVILMTVTDDEYCTVMANTKPLTGYPHIIETRKDIVFWIGQYGCSKVVILKTTSGQEEILQDLPRLLSVVKAKYIISVGMCYGMNEEKTKLGDVLVSKVIHNFTKEHKGEHESIFEDSPYAVPHGILSLFKSKVGFKLKRFEDDVEVKACPLVSSQTVINDPKYKEAIRTQAPKALGGEMEGAAIVTVTIALPYDHHPKPDVIVIKGIADWGDGEKEKARKWQKFAAHAAAKYVLFQMKKPDALMDKDVPTAGGKPESDKPLKGQGKIESKTSTVPAGQGIEETDTGDAQLDITDLNAVINKLSALKFPIAEWKRLGRNLGLYKPSTLDVIAADNPNNTKECLCECLAAWLRKKDGVISTSWSSLKEALKAMDESDIAEKI